MTLPSGAGLLPRSQHWAPEPGRPGVVIRFPAGRCSGRACLPRSRACLAATITYLIRRPRQDGWRSDMPLSILYQTSVSAQADGTENLGTKRTSAPIFCRLLTIPRIQASPPVRRILIAHAMPCWAHSAEPPRVAAGRARWSARPIEVSYNCWAGWPARARNDSAPRRSVMLVLAWQRS